VTFSIFRQAVLQLSREEGINPEQEEGLLLRGEIFVPGFSLYLRHKVSRGIGELGTETIFCNWGSFRRKTFLTRRLSIFSRKNFLLRRQSKFFFVVFEPICKSH
jgi:hypothetical protein